MIIYVRTIVCVIAFCGRQIYRGSNYRRAIYAFDALIFKFDVRNELFECGLI